MDNRLPTSEFMVYGHNSDDDFTICDIKQKGITVGRNAYIWPWEHSYCKLPSSLLEDRKGASAERKIIWEPLFIGSNCSQ